MENASFLEAVSVTKNYKCDHESGINKVSINIQQGKITAVVGESGSGKSTLLNLLYGFLSPDEGQVIYKGEKVIGPVEKLIPGHDAMKMVTQHTADLNLFATVRENVASLLPNTDLDNKERRTTEVLAQLRITHLKDNRVTELSGGEKQRTAIAKALVTRPEVLLLDEPFNQVDASFREGLQQNIRQIVKDTGLTVILVSHDPAEVLSMADVLVVIKQGEIVEYGTPRELYENPQMVYTAQILANCTLLTLPQALKCGIKAKRGTIAVYPEHIEISKGWGRKDWIVKQVLFKGLYEQLVIEKDNIRIQVANWARGKYTEGEKIGIRIEKHLEFGKWE